MEDDYFKNRSNIQSFLASLINSPRTDLDIISKWIYRFLGLLLLVLIIVIPFSYILISQYVSQSLSLVILIIQILVGLFIFGYYLIKVLKSFMEMNNTRLNDYEYLIKGNEIIISKDGYKNKISTNRVISIKYIPFYKYPKIHKENNFFSGGKGEILVLSFPMDYRNYLISIRKGKHEVKYLIPIYEDNVVDRLLKAEKEFR